MSDIVPSFCTKVLVAKARSELVGTVGIRCHLTVPLGHSSLENVPDTTVDHTVREREQGE